jgi:hypothetical protein
MIQEFTIWVTDILNRFSPYIIGGAIGSIIHRMRTEMDFTTFLKSLVMGVFISVCTGIFAKDYIGIKNDNIIFVLCGLSGTFSKLILDEFEQIIKLGVVYAKIKLGIKKPETDDDETSTT